MWSRKGQMVGGLFEVVVVFVSAVEVAEMMVAVEVMVVVVVAVA